MVYEVYISNDKSRPFSCYKYYYEYIKGLYRSFVVAHIPIAL